MFSVWLLTEIKSDDPIKEIAGYTSLERAQDAKALQDEPDDYAISRLTVVEESDWETES